MTEMGIYGCRGRLCDVIFAQNLSHFSEAIYDRKGIYDAGEGRSRAR
jgi:hypothetical protein